MSAQQPLGASPQEAGMRQSALLLHAMHQDDRHWLLDQLPVAEKQQIAFLLEELQVLGIPRSHDLLQSAIAQVDDGQKDAGPKDTAPKDDAPVLSPFASLVHTLDRIPAHDRAPAWTRLCALFKEEPAGLLAQLMQVHGWSWQEAVLESLTPRKRARIQEISAQLARQSQNAGSSMAATDLRAALLDVVAERVMQAEPVPAEDTARTSEKTPPLRWAWWPRRARAAGQNIAANLP